MTLAHFLPRMTDAMLVLAERLIDKQKTRKAIRERRLHLKSIGQVVQEYQNALENLVVDATNGNIGVAAFRTRHNTLIDELAQPAYIEGMREGGIPDPENDMTEEDETTIGDWRLDQLGYVQDFARACVDAGKLEGDERLSARNGLMVRAGLWAGKLQELGSKGYAVAKLGVRSFWELGATEVHCDSCLKYSNMQPHRLQWWHDSGYLPKSSELDCGGFNCDCKIKSVATGEVLYPRE